MENNMNNNEGLPDNIDYTVNDSVEEFSNSEVDSFLMELWPISEQLPVEAVVVSHNEDQEANQEESVTLQELVTVETYPVNDSSLGGHSSEERLRLINYDNSVHGSNVGQEQEPGEEFFVKGQIGLPTPKNLPALEERSTAVLVIAPSDLNAEDEECSIHEDRVDEEMKENEVTAEEHVKTQEKISVDDTVISSIPHSLGSNCSLVSILNPLTKKEEAGTEAGANQNLHDKQSINIGQENNPGGSTSTKRKNTTPQHSFKKRMKNDSVCEYYTKPKQRLETFKKSGECIGLQCKGLQEKTGCAVYYGAQYTSISGKRFHYSFGEYFPDPDAEVETPSNTKPVATPSPAPPPLIAPKLPGDTVQIPFVVPPSPPLQPKPVPVGSTESCSTCNKQLAIGPDLKKIETQWAHCHGRDDQPCSKRVHTVCLGFLGTNFKLPNYYCLNHIYGPKTENVNIL